MKTADAIKAFGTAAALADALGITRQAITNWGDDVPEVRRYHIEAVAKERGLELASQG